LLSDPLAVTYNGSSKSLPRVSGGNSRSVYRTADEEFEVSISNSKQSVSSSIVSITLTRKLPDVTPLDAFDPYRSIKNSFTLVYEFDDSRAQTSVDIPLLRTALLALVDTTLQSRLIAGEK